MFDEGFLKISLKFMVTKLETVRYCSETITIRKALKETIKMGTSKVVLESNSQIAIISITGSRFTPKLMRNLIEDIKNQAKCINSIQLACYNRKAYGLAGG